MCRMELTGRTEKRATKEIPVQQARKATKVTRGIKVTPGNAVYRDYRDRRGNRAYRDPKGTQAQPGRPVISTSSIRPWLIRQVPHR